MHTIQIKRQYVPEDEPPALIIQEDGGQLEATSTWQFMVDNLRPDWLVTLLDESGKVLRESSSGDTKKLTGLRRW